MPEHPVAVQSRLSRSAAVVLGIMASTALTQNAWAGEFAAVESLAAASGAKGKRINGDNPGDKTGNCVAQRATDSPYDKQPQPDEEIKVIFSFVKDNGIGLALKYKELPVSNDPISISQLPPSSTLFTGPASSHTPPAVAGLHNFGGADLELAASVFVGLNLDAAYIIFVQKLLGHSRAPTPFDVSSLDGGNGFKLQSSAFDGTGASVSGAGDVNRDGFGDAIMGAPLADVSGTDSGSVYVVFGRSPPFASVIGLSTLNGGNGFRLNGILAGDMAGSSVAGAGDINGDGFDDLIVGASYADPNGSASGQAFVIFGKGTPFAPAVNLSTLSGTNGFRFNGGAQFDRAGISVSGAGDVNGDGFADVIIGARGVDANGSQSGASYVIFGKSTPFLPVIEGSSLTGGNGFRLDGTSFSYNGRSVSGGGDINGDGFDDVISGAYQGNRSFVLFGKASGFTSAINPSTLNGNNGFRLDGATAGDQAGTAVAGSGDLDGDGFGDLMVGAPRADPGGLTDAGSTFVLLGRAPNSARTRIGSAAPQYISGGSFADTLRGMGGGDTLEGRGAGDVLDGGLGNDTASYLHAPTAVTADLQTPAANLGQAAGDSYVLIENLTGSAKGDRLLGNAAANRLTGGPGADSLTGRGGPDVYVYRRIAESPPGVGRDRIDGFEAGGPTTRVDRIDLQAIDANGNLPGDQAFTYRHTLAFTAAGQIRLQVSGTTTFVLGNVDSNLAPDFQIALTNFTGIANLSAIDFVR